MTGERLLHVSQVKNRFADRLGDEARQLTRRFAGREVDQQAGHRADAKVVPEREIPSIEWLPGAMNDDAANVGDDSSRR